MPSSTRLDKETEEVLNKTVEYLGSTKSEIVRKSIKEYCLKVIEENKKTPWAIYQLIHTHGGSGHGKRVLMSKDILKGKLEANRKKWLS